MLIAVGILAALTVIALTAAASLIADSRAKQTKATMRIVEAAIQQFIRDNPFGNCKAVEWQTLRAAPNSYTDADPKTKPWIVEYKLSGPPQRLNGACRDSVRLPLFERFPPCPLTTFSPSPNETANYTRSSGPPQIPPYPGSADQELDTQAKFIRLINIMRGSDLSSVSERLYWKIVPNYVNRTENYASIECLLYALSEFSPGARRIMDQLEGKPVLGNLDKDFTYEDAGPPAVNAFNGRFDPGERQVPLYEILDGWKRPIRYALLEAMKADISNPTQGSGIKWELRSAGDDGIFSPPFTPADRSDDVILQGP
jgi:type II secretory pathway pseudopilin PulG